MNELKERVRIIQSHASLIAPFPDSFSLQTALPFGAIIVQCSANLLPILLTKQVNFAMETGENDNVSAGMGWRIAATILTFFGAVIGIILWLFFYAASFNVYQNIAMVVVFLVALVAAMGATWASWGMKQARWHGKGGPESCKD